MFIRPVISAVLLLLAPLCSAVLAKEQLTVFSAASLTDVMTELAATYTEQTGQPVILSFASSSTLARQIEAGAPATVFASASEIWADYLVQRGRLDASSLISPVHNRLILVAPRTGRYRQELQQRTSDPVAQFSRLGPRDYIALGDPDHVPAGIYGRQALEHFGLWGEFENRLARTDNVRAALALVSRGEVPLGMVYATDAARVDTVEVVADIPSSAHRDIRYAFGLVEPEPMARPSPLGEAFLDFLISKPAQDIFAAHGFDAAYPS